MAPPSGQRGFTLVELLVAMALLAVLSLLSWRGLDVLWRTREHTQAQVVRVAALHTVLAQWQSDLDALQGVAGLSASGLQWDGLTLRLIRRPAAGAVDADRGLSVVAWTARGGQWLRWQSAPSVQRAELQRAWAQAQQWGRSVDGQAGATVLSNAEAPGVGWRLVPLEGWQLFYFRGNAWTNPLSAAGTSDNAASSSIPDTAPDAIRLQLDLPADSGLPGRLVLDWVRPTFHNTKS